MTLKVLSILCYIVAGFFFYVTCLLGFVQAPDAAAKCWVLGVFLTPALILLAIGAVCSPDRRWKREFGIVLTASAGISAFIVFSMACIFMEPEFRKLIRPDQIEFFGNYKTGVVWIGLLGALGGLLLYAAREKT